MNNQEADMAIVDTTKLEADMAIVDTTKLDTTKAALLDHPLPRANLMDRFEVMIPELKELTNWTLFRFIQQRQGSHYIRAGGEKVYLSHAAMFKLQNEKSVIESCRDFKRRSGDDCYFEIPDHYALIVILFVYDIDGGDQLINLLLRLKSDRLFDLLKVTHQYYEHRFEEYWRMLVDYYYLPGKTGIRSNKEEAIMLFKLHLLGRLYDRSDFEKVAGINLYIYPQEGYETMEIDELSKLLESCGDPKGLEYNTEWKITNLLAWKAGDLEVMDDLRNQRRQVTYSAKHNAVSVVTVYLDLKKLDKDTKSFPRSELSIIKKLSPMINRVLKSIDAKEISLSRFADDIDISHYEIKYYSLIRQLIITWLDE